ncbi:hypothetical protein HOA55_00765 [archaeon]|jgi:hypothetical protein|nr:hypothetical protein [archaeon]MBT3578213.1 hypothetical protein [archaeon]MBT6819866.1 hypothetical protein [archaeon]MBT6956574.1 hypothetical protein [archaeon]MBT7025648.1 hypothetical protein [archaeon]
MVKLSDLNLEEISQEEVSNRTFLGQATGMGLGHCVWLGTRHGPKGFLDNVRSYVVHEQGPAKMDVTFYGDPSDKST